MYAGASRSPIPTQLVAVDPAGGTGPLVVVGVGRTVEVVDVTVSVVSLVSVGSVVWVVEGSSALTTPSPSPPWAATVTVATPTTASTTAATRRSLGPRITRWAASTVPMAAGDAVRTS